MTLNYQVKTYFIGDGESDDFSDWFPSREEADAEFERQKQEYLANPDEYEYFMDLEIISDDEDYTKAYDLRYWSDEEDFPSELEKRMEENENV